MRTATKIDSFAPVRFGLSACPSMSLAARGSIRYRLEWLALKAATKFIPLLSRKACYRIGQNALETWPQFLPPIGRS
jgi:hypothetical protein